MTREQAILILIPLLGKYIVFDFFSGSIGKRGTKAGWLNNVSFSETTNEMFVAQGNDVIKFDVATIAELHARNESVFTKVYP